MGRPRPPPRAERARFRYAACYCEENVWHLAESDQLPAPEGDRFVVFISNARRCCPLWSQRSASAPGEPVLWDYHVVLLTRGEPLVYDLDTTLPFPVSLDGYLAGTFPEVARVPVSLAPRFRVIAAAEFRATFASDRSHMLEDGVWKAPPPGWAPIRTEREVMNLDRFIDVGPDWVGEVLDLEGLRVRFAP